jgi:hypothetical protein
MTIVAGLSIQGMMNLLSSMRKRSPSITRWAGNACCRFMKLLTRIKNMIKISRCIGEVRKKWYARNRKAWARYLLLMDRMTLFALIAAARLVGVLKVTTLERRGILGRIEVSGGSESGETSGLRRDLVE